MKDVDCFIHNNEVVVDTYINDSVFIRFHNNTLSPTFIYLKITDDGGIIKYCANKSDCIFGNYRVMKNNYPEYFI